jgi:predicted metal-dependent phosphoesterase TrpH
MLKFMRNKRIGIWLQNADTVRIHGLLDDDIYSLEVVLSVRLSDLEIRSIDGKWNRWTTPECRRAVPFLQDAVGFGITSEDFSQSINKIIGRKACRHFANLILECCDAAREAAMVVQWEKRRVDTADLGFDEFLAETPSKDVQTADARPKPGEKAPSRIETAESDRAVKGAAEGIVIDIHVHSSPASPCSSAPVDKLIREAKQIGLHGICITDHNYVWKSETIQDLRQKHGFLVLRGNEITTDQGDILVFGLDEDIRGIIRLEDLREKVSDTEGFMIAAHPFRGFLTFGIGELGLTPEKAMERPFLKLIDAVEVLNGKVTKKENEFALNVAKGLGLPVTGGSDAHEVDEVGTYATQFHREIENEKDLIEALKSGDYAAVAYRREWVSKEI